MLLLLVSTDIPNIINVTLRATVGVYLTLVQPFVGLISAFEQMFLYLRKMYLKVLYCNHAIYFI